MKPPATSRLGEALPEGAAGWLVTTGVFAVVHFVCGRIVAASDLVSDVLSGRPAVILVALALMAVRMYLYLLAPGWALYVTLKHLLRRRKT